MSRAVSISSWRFPCWDARHGAQLHETRLPRRNCDRDCALAAAELHVSAESPRRNILQIQLALPAERRRVSAQPIGQRQLAESGNDIALGAAHDNRTDDR